MFVCLFCLFVMLLSVGRWIEGWMHGGPRSVLGPRCQCECGHVWSLVVTSLARAWRVRCSGRVYMCAGCGARGGPTRHTGPNRLAKVAVEMSRPRSGRSRTGSVRCGVRCPGGEVPGNVPLFSVCDTIKSPARSGYTRGDVACGPFSSACRIYTPRLSLPIRMPPLPA